eukprot:gb/GECG01001739.1/.p1 GENE.gb/GECG01001739.1/~~gb/GECG01001739.1/.p1  ORF type:complete len:175 (+),score=15.93 gb/GECG01001739.1/:1-525(+)
MDAQGLRISEEEKGELFDACQGRHGDLATISRILAKYPSTSITAIRDEMGLTPLHHAARFGFANIVKDLVERYCANVAVKDPLCGLTPLHFATHATKGSEDVIQLLIGRYFGDVHCRANNGDTPLHTAAYQGNESATAVLITQFKANIHQPNNVGYNVPVLKTRDYIVVQSFTA